MIGLFQNLGDLKLVVWNKVFLHLNFMGWLTTMNDKLLTTTTITVLNIQIIIAQIK